MRVHSMAPPARRSAAHVTHDTVRLLLLTALAVFLFAVFVMLASRIVETYSGGAAITTTDTVFDTRARATVNA